MGIELPPNRRPPCYVCNKAEGNTDEHHILPREYGGDDDGKKVPLCAACHRGVHREAEALYAGKEISGFRDHLSSLASNERAIAEHKFTVLRDYVMQMKQRHESSGKVKADTARNMVSVSLTEQQLRMLHSVKKSMGLTSIQTTLEQLIENKYVDLLQRTRTRGKS